MEMTRVELLEGVWLNHLRSGRSKTACLSISLLTSLKQETAAMNALLPHVLRRGCTRYADEQALGAQMAALGGLTVEPLVRRVGEIQAVGLIADIPADAPRSGQPDVLRRSCALLGELLLSPATRGGLLLPQHVDGERDRLVRVLQERGADRAAYAAARCTEEMCCCEDYAVGAFGSEADMAAVRYQKLSKHYRALLPVCPIEIVYCGPAGKKQLADSLREALATLPRGEIDLELGTEIRMNALEDQPRVLTEALPGGPDELAIGWRLGDCMEDPDPAALRVFAHALGSELPDMHKGLLLLLAEIAPGGRQAAQEEIFRRLDALRRGALDEQALQTARVSAAAELRAAADSPRELEDFWFSQVVFGLDYGPEELAELCGDVTGGELAAIANSLDCDVIYLLTGEEEEPDGDLSERDE